MLRGIFLEFSPMSHLDDDAFNDMCELIDTLDEKGWNHPNLNDIPHYNKDQGVVVFRTLWSKETDEDSDPTREVYKDHIEKDKQALLPFLKNAADSIIRGNKKNKPTMQEKMFSKAINAHVANEVKRFNSQKKMQNESSKKCCEKLWDFVKPASIITDDFELKLINEISSDLQSPEIEIKEHIETLCASDLQQMPFSIPDLQVSFIPPLQRLTETMTALKILTLFANTYEMPFNETEPLTKIMQRISSWELSQRFLNKKYGFEARYHPDTRKFEVSIPKGLTYIPSELLPDHVGGYFRPKKSAPLEHLSSNNRPKKSEQPNGYAPVRFFNYAPVRIIKKEREKPYARPEKNNRKEAPTVCNRK